MSTVLLETDVFSILFDDRPGAVEFAAAVDGLRAPLTFVSVAELTAGARLANWGPKRTARLEAEIAKAGYLMPTGTILRLCGELRADAVRLGHPLGDPRHANDLWIAACAVHYGVPLLTNNERHFVDFPGLELARTG